jgi:alpha-tubulin suppressor-like RCC1 family protein
VAQDLSGRASLSHVVQVEAGAANTVALVDDGSVVAWGTWTGNGTTSSSTLPTAVLLPDGSGPLTHVVAVSAGGSFSLALTDDGHVDAWGDDLNDGRLGSGAVLGTVQPLPNRVERADGTDLADIVQISAGDDFSLALAADGTVWAWGNNSYGQIGQNAQNGSRPVAMQVKGPDGVDPLGRIAMVAAGGNHALALDLDGRVLAWGYGPDGALGDGPNRPAGNQALLPRVVVSDTGAVTGFTDVVSIAAGYGSSQALRADGTVLSWGANFRSALGRATTATNDPTPAAVSGVGGGTLTVDVGAYPNLLRRAR